MSGAGSGALKFVGRRGRGQGRHAAYFRKEGVTASLEGWLQKMETSAAKIVVSTPFRTTVLMIVNGLEDR